MDNVTHTLIGLAVGQGFVGRRPEDPALGRAIVWASIIGNNLPDLDFVVPPLLASATGSTKLAYLLHHRGHSHTLIVGLGLALVVAALAARIGRVPLRAH